MADWLMIIITAIYVVATIFICRANFKSAAEAKKQVEESRKQFDEINRAYVTCEYILSNRVYCGIRICNHGNQVARNLTIKINKEFIETLNLNEFINFEKINESVYTLVGVGQSYYFYFADVKNKPQEVPLIVTVNYESNNRSYKDVFELDLSKQLPLESVDTEFDKYLELIKNQNELLSDISQNIREIVNK